MKLILMTNNENIELYKELRREFIMDTYEQYLQLILSDICQELEIDISVMIESNFHKELRRAMIAIINKVWLDNLIKYIIHSDIHTFMTLVNRQMLGQDIFVSSFYSRQISDIFVKYIDITTDELNRITDILANRLYWIINSMYKFNSDRYNEVLIHVMNNINIILTNIQFNYYKIELDPYFRPLLFYTEKKSNEYLCA